MTSSLPTSALGTLLRRYRLRMGLTQRDLARRARVSVEAVSTLERGTRRAPRDQTIDLLAGALGLSPVERGELHRVARGQRVGRVEAGVHHPPIATRPPPPLVGRTREVARLERHLAGAGPPVLLLAGEPGIGKTRLLAEASQRAKRRGWTVLEGGCHRRSGQEPYAPLLSALEGRLRPQPPPQRRQDLDGCTWLVRLLPELAADLPAPSWTLPPAHERRLMFASVARYLDNIAAPAGTLLLLDDLQWAGTDALDLLGALLRAPGPHPLRIVGAYRSTEVRSRDALDTLRAELGAVGLAEEVSLGPLAPEEAGELLGSVLEGGEDTDTARREQVLTRTGGVPYFLISCARALRGGAQDGRAPREVPWNVMQSIRQRADALPPAAQALLGVAAVGGRSVPGALLLRIAEASGQPRQEAIGALEAMSQAGMLVEEEQRRYRFPHDLIREAVSADLSAMRRANLHRQIAEALEHEPGDVAVEQLAYHFDRAGDLEKAAAYLERAGDRASAVHANAEAEGIYRRTVAHLEQLGRARDAARVRISWGVTLRSLGHCDEALGVLQDAFGTYRRADDTDGLARAALEIGHVHLHRHTIAEGVAWLEPLVAGLRRTGPSPGAAHLSFALSQLYSVAGDYRRELDAIEQAQAAAPDIYDGSGAGRWWRSGHASVLYVSGRLEEAAQILEELVVVGDETVKIEAWNTLAAVHLAWGNFGQERHCIEQGLALAEEIGDRPAAIFARHRRGRNAFFRGEWALARVDLEESLHQAEQQDASASARRGLFTVARHDFLRFGVGMLCLAEGRRDEAVRLLERELTSAGSQSIRPMAVRWTQMVLAERDILDGDPGAARARLEPLLDRSNVQETDVTRLLPFLAWAYLDLGEEARAEATAQQALTRARAQRMRPSLVDALRTLALLRMRRQRWDEAAIALDEALALCRAMPHPYAEAKVLYVCGQLHAATGETPRARERCGQALSILDRLGERLYAERVERTLSGSR